MTRGPARRRPSPRRGRPESPAPQSFPGLAGRSSTSPDDRTEASVTVAGTLRREGGDPASPNSTEGASVVLVSEDGRAYLLQLPPGWSVEAEAGARGVVSGDLTGEGLLRVRRIATA